MPCKGRPNVSNFSSPVKVSDKRHNFKLIVRQQVLQKIKNINKVKVGEAFIKVEQVWEVRV